MVAVNRELIDVYRDIGKTIHEQQQTAEWGSSVVEHLAIEQWGSGLNRISEVCRQQHINAPKFEELDHFFRVTLYPRTAKVVLFQAWHTPIIKHIQQHGKISAIEAEKLWKLTRRTATNRLKKMCQEGLLVELSTGPFDPYKTFILAEPRKT